MSRGSFLNELGRVNEPGVMIEEPVLTNKPGMQMRSLAYKREGGVLLLNTHGIFVSTGSSKITPGSFVSTGSP